MPTALGLYKEYLQHTPYAPGKNGACLPEVNNETAPKALKIISNEKIQKYTERELRDFRKSRRLLFKGVGKIAIKEKNNSEKTQLENINKIDKEMLEIYRKSYRKILNKADKALKDGFFVGKDEKYWNLAQDIKKIKTAEQGEQVLRELRKFERNGEHMENDRLMFLHDVINREDRRIR